MSFQRPGPRLIAAGASILGLLALALAFWTNALGSRPARDEGPALSPKHYDTAPARVVRKTMSVDDAPCASCHDGSEPLQGNPKERGVFHEAIVLKHGRNQHCFNCHHRVKPENFADFDGAVIALANTQMLCARCHGPTYRDWETGAHGRRMGHWDVSKGGPKPTTCIACHDPHWPVFKEMEAAPAPRVNPRRPGGEKH